MNSDGWVGTIRGKPGLGDSVERSRAVSERDIALFTEITGDRNPLHYDREIAARSVFGGLIVQGGITSGILNAIVAEDLPGPGTVFLPRRLNREDRLRAQRALARSLLLFPHRFGSR
jgi:hypothetical protein